MDALICELALAYIEAGLDCANGLLPPATEGEIDSVATALKQPVHADLRAVWRVFGGQPYFGAGVSGLFGRHRLLAPAEAIKKHQLIWDCEPETPPALATPKLYNRPVLELVPFAGWDAYALCLHSVSGEVWEYLPSPGLLRHSPNLETIVRELLAATRSGSEEPDFEG